MLEEDSLAPFGTLATTDRRKERYFVSHADFAPEVRVVAVDEWYERAWQSTVSSRCSTSAS